MRTLPTIRAMSEEDIEHVLYLQARAYAGYPLESRTVLAEKLSLFPTGCWIALLDEQVAGYLFSHPWARDKAVELDTSLGTLPLDPDCYYIHDLAIDPRFERQGIGRQLFFRARAVARELKLDTLALVAVQNSETFWMKCGFQPVVVPSSEMADKLMSYGPGASLMIAEVAGSVNLEG